MKLASVLNAAKKAGLEVTKSEFTSNRYFVSHADSRYIGAFFVQGDNAICVHTHLKNDRPDGMTDYFPETYHTTVKRFISTLSPEKKGV